MDSTNRVVQRIRRPALLGGVIETVAVSEALLRPDQRHAVGSRRNAIGGYPAGAALPPVGDVAEGEVDGAICGYIDARRQRLGLHFVGVGRELVLLLIEVLHVVGLGEDLDDVAEVQDVAGVKVGRHVQSAQAEALGEPQVEVLERGQAALVQPLGEFPIAVVARHHVLVG